jgi:hypothetical protein
VTQEQIKADVELKISMQREFLKDQSKTKKAEMSWFDKLEDELDRMEMDEKLLEYKIANSKKMLQKELMEGEKKISSQSVRIPL